MWNKGGSPIVTFAMGHEVQTESLTMTHSRRRWVKDSVGRFLHHPWHIWSGNYKSLTQGAKHRLLSSKPLFYYDETRFDSFMHFHDSWPMLRGLMADCSLTHHWCWSSRFETACMHSFHKAFYFPNRVNPLSSELRRLEVMRRQSSSPPQLPQYQ